MTAQTFKTVDILRLEVEDTPEGPANLLLNPTGALGSWGWLSPVPGSRIEGFTDSVGPGLWFSDASATNPGVPNWFTSEPFPVTGGYWLTAVWKMQQELTEPEAQFNDQSFEFLDASGTLIETSAKKGSSSYSPTQHRRSPVLIPAGAYFARLRFDLYDSALKDPPYGDAMIIREVAVAEAPTSAELAGVDYAPPPVLDILGPTISIGVTREALNLGTLTAVVRDSSLDPSQADTIRPGRRDQLLVHATDTDTWEPLFTGKTQDAQVGYGLKNPSIPDTKRTRIDLTVVDNVAALANQKRPEGVATIQQLPAVLEGCGVPWNVNGNTWQIDEATVVAVNEAASAADQVAITRDSEHGHAWVDRAGVVQAWSPWEMPTAPITTLDESDYVDLDLSYSTGTCINEVTINFLRYNPTTGETQEIPYGPYRDQASIQQWGAHSAEFTIQGLTEDAATIEDYAQAVLDANATPQVRINSVTLNVGTTADLTRTRALLDLGDLVQVVNTSKGIAHPARIEGITHSITTDKWMMTLTFAAPESVAAPTWTPPVQTHYGTNADDWVPWNSGVPSGWTVRYKITSGWCYVQFNTTGSVSVSSGNNTIATGFTDAVVPRDGATDGVWSAAYIAGNIGMVGIWANGNIVVRAASAASGSVSGALSFPVVRA